MKSTYIFLSLLFLVACKQSKEIHITEFSQDHINNGIVIDVRTPKEFAAGHLDNAININWFNTAFASSFDTIPKNTNIYVYCKKGGRSSKAAILLDSLGYKNVIDLLGGYDELTNE